MQLWKTSETDDTLKKDCASVPVAQQSSSPAQDRGGWDVCVRACVRNDKLRCAVCFGQHISEMRHSYKLGMCI